MADLRIEQLPTALTLALADLVPLAAYDEQVETGYKASKITAAEIAAALLTTFEQSGLTTTSKTIVGAINEIASGGAGAAHVIAGSSDPTSAQGNDLDLYVKYATSGGETSVTGLFVKLSGAWVSIVTGGGTGAFYITMTQSGSSYSVDKTKDEIDGAYADGQALVVIFNVTPKKYFYLAEFKDNTSYKDYYFSYQMRQGAWDFCLTTHSGGVVIQNFNITTLARIDNTATETSSAWSSSKTHAEDLATLSSAENYTDEAIVDILPTDTASGSVANFETSLALPLVECKAQIVPIQEGTGDPSPSNVRPISGWTACKVTRTGANIWDEQWESGGFNNAGEPVADSTRIRTINFIPIKQNTTYFAVSSVTLGFRFYDENHDFISGGSQTRNTTFTTPTNAAYLKFAIVQTTTYGNDVSINYPSTDTTYHAYSSGNTYEIDLDGTVYGGELDVKRGVLTITHRFQALDALNWSKNGSTITFYSESLTGLQGETDDFYCSCYLPTINGGYNGQDGKTSIKSSGDTSRIWVADSSYSTSADFKASLAGQTIVLKIATPTEITLTTEEITTLVGVNNIWADTGDISVEFKMSIKDYIDIKLASLSSGTRSVKSIEEPKTEEKTEEKETEGGENER